MDAQEAAGYADSACEEAKKLKELRYIVSSCNLKARACFIQGKEEEAVKLFKENAENAFKYKLFGMDLSKIANAFVRLVASHVAEGDLEKALEEYKRHEHFIANFPSDWALLTGLMVVHGIGELEGVFEEARRVLLEQRSPSWIKPILECIYSSEECVNVDPCKKSTGIDYDDCRVFVELADNPEQLKNSIIPGVEGEERDILKILLDDINDYRQIVEVVALISDSGASFAEALRLISHRDFVKARAIAKLWYKRLGKVGSVQASQLWRELDESLKEEKCGNRCRKALQELFFFIV